MNLRGGRQSTFRSEGGVTLPFAAISLVALLGIVGLALDTTMTLLALRDAQRSLDAASLAAVNSLRNPSRIDGWKNAKKAGLAALSINRLIGLDATALSSLESSSAPESFRFDAVTTSNTPLDDVGYDRNTGVRGNLSITLVRGLFCYDPDPDHQGSFIRRWYSLDKDFPSRYCYANSVRMRAEIRHIPTSFIRVLGMSVVPRILVLSTSYVKPPNSCGFPLCRLLGMPDSSSDELATHFLPTVSCP